MRTLFFIMLVGCAGFERDCSSSCAQEMGADWIIVQYRFDGEPINCWKLLSVGVRNEENSDGLFWKSNHGHLIHVAGWYNRVQVENGDFEGAAHEIGIESSRCIGGHYDAPEQPE